MEGSEATHEVCDKVQSTIELQRRCLKLNIGVR